MKILKNVFLVLIAIVLSLPLGSFIGNLYANFFNAHGTFVNMASFVGIPFGYELLVPLLFIAFGGEGKSKYWWIGILLIPALVLEVYLDLGHIYFPIILALLGWGIGFGIQKLVKKIRR